MLVEYQQTYAPELIRLKRDITAAVPKATEWASMESNWQSPENSGTISGIDWSFQKIIGMYRVKLRKMGKLTDEPTRDEMDALSEERIGAQRP
jgi:hypothetical protein